MIKSYRFFPLICSLLVSVYWCDLMAQNPVEAIRDLKQGYLIVRFPSYKSKIDTLASMISRTDDAKSKKRLTKLLDEATYQRDSLRTDYIEAFRNLYDFSKVAWYMDYESRNLPNARFHDLDGSRMSYEELKRTPSFYMLFEKTKESNIDGIVIYNQDMKMLPQPFPNNFTRGGFSFLFVKLAEQKFADWRVKKMNKRFYKFWEDFN